MTTTGTEHDRSTGAEATSTAPLAPPAPSATAAVDLLCLLDRYGATHGAGDVSLKSSILELSRARRNAVGSGYCGDDDGMGNGSASSSSSPSRSSASMTASSYSAFDVREELRARAVLQRCRKRGVPTDTEKKNVAVIPEDGEPELVSATYSTDGDVTPTKSHTAKGPQMSEGEELSFVLHLDGGAKIVAPKSPPRKKPQAAPPAPMGSRGDGIMDMGLRRRRNAAGDDDDESKKWTVEEETQDDDEDEDDDAEDRLLQTCDPIDLFGALPPPALRAAQRRAREALMRYVEAANLVAEMERLLLVSNQDGGK